MNASLEVMNFETPSRRDDLKMLCYMICGMFNGGILPGVSDKLIDKLIAKYKLDDNQATYRNIQVAKKKMSLTQLASIDSYFYKMFVQKVFEL